MHDESPTRDPLATPTPAPVRNLPPQVKPLTPYGMAERSDPLRQCYVMTEKVGGLRRRPGEAFRDPTNGKIYVVGDDGSLRRATETRGADGKPRFTLRPRSQRQRKRR